MEGYLWKQATSGKKDIKYRYFILQHIQEPLASKKNCIGVRPNNLNTSQRYALCFWRSHEEINGIPIRVIYLDETFKLVQQPYNTKKEKHTLSLSIPDEFGTKSNVDIHLHTSNYGDFKCWYKKLNDIIQKNFTPSGIESPYDDIPYPIQASDEKVPVNHTITEYESSTHRRYFGLTSSSNKLDSGYTSSSSVYYDYPTEEAVPVRLNSAPTKPHSRLIELPPRSQTGELPPNNVRTSNKILPSKPEKNVRRFSVSIDNEDSIDFELGKDINAFNLTMKPDGADYENLSFAFKYKKEKE